MGSFPFKVARELMRQSELREMEDNGKLLSYGVINTNPSQLLGEGSEVFVEAQSTT